MTRGCVLRRYTTQAGSVAMHASWRLVPVLHVGHAASANTEFAHPERIAPTLFSLLEDLCVGLHVGVLTTCAQLVRRKFCEDELVAHIPHCLWFSVWRPNRDQICVQATVVKQLLPRTDLSTRLAVGRRAPCGALPNSNFPWIAEVSRLPRPGGGSRLWVSRNPLLWVSRNPQQAQTEFASVKTIQK